MTAAPFGPLKQINAGLLNVGSVEVGPHRGQLVVLLPGWPYDIYSFADVAPALGAASYPVIVPFLRRWARLGFCPMTGSGPLAGPLR